MRQILLFFALQLATFTFAQAQQKCSDFFKLEPPSTPQATTQTTDSLETHRLELLAALHEKLDFEEKIDSLLTEWRSTLGDTLTFTNLSIQISPHDSYLKSTFGYSFQRGKVIQMGLRLGNFSARDRDAVFAHEFGHALFLENMFVPTQTGPRHKFEEMEAASAESAQKLSTNERYIALKAEIQRILTGIDMARRLGKQDTFGELFALLELKRAELSAMNPAGALSNFLYDILTPYNELFADSFAVLMFKDPQLMSRATSYDKEPALEQLLFNMSYRDGNANRPNHVREFSRVPFKNWKHELSDIYTLLDPARGVLWDLYMKNIKDEHRALFLRTFLDAVEAHVSEQSKNKTLKNPALLDVNLNTFNKDFLRHFTKAARKNGLPITKG